jgi:hypothetical protein
MIHVASSQRSRGVEAVDGCVDATGCNGPFFPSFVIIVVLGPMGILVF